MEDRPPPSVPQDAASVEHESGRASNPFLGALADPAPVNDGTVGEEPQRFQNFDQKANQMYNMLSSLMKTSNEQRQAPVRNMI